MINKTYYFLSGLPRSGSTVLTSILNQNPAVFATPTSPLLDQLIENQNIWHNLQTVKANPIPVQLDNITRRMINSMWSHVPQNVIIDKNRGWGKNMPAAEILFQKKIKMIAVKRDLPSIMASWLTVLKNNPNSYLDQKLIQQGKQLTDVNRMDEMWHNMVKDCVESLQQALIDAKNQVLVVNYDDIVDNPKQILYNIEQFLDIPSHVYDFNNIENTYKDDDLAAWGLDGMHKIRSELKKTSKDPQEILGDEMFYKYKSIEQLYKIKE